MLKQASLPQNVLRSLFLGMSSLALLAGCETLAVAPNVADVDPRLKKSRGGSSGAAAPAIPASEIAGTAPVRFSGARVTVPRNRVIATSRGNFNISCAGIGTRQVTLGELAGRSRESSAMRRTFNDAMVEAGIKVPTVSGSVFAAAQQSAPYQVGATITDMKFKLCAATSAWDSRYIGMIGAAAIDVTFEVYSNLQARVVYRKTVLGGGRLNTPRKDGIKEIYLRAFGDAAGRLARDPGFIRAISAPAGTQSVPRTNRPIRLIGSPSIGGAIVGNMNRIRRATVVISTAGHGSGFLIDRRGYILTNAHVVGDAAQVRVQLFRGPGVIGQVIRVDRIRDVALIKIAPPGRAPLPLRRTRGRVGEEVYAVGAPTQKALEATVSRGVIGGVRRGRGGLIYLQADATIHPGSSGGPLVDRSGNVIGLAVAAVIDRTGRTASGLNLFIPVGDALKRLNLRY